MTPAMPNSSGSTPGRKRTPKISTPPMPMHAQQHQDRAHAARDRRRIGAQEPEDAEAPGPRACERQEDRPAWSGLGVRWRRRMPAASGGESGGDCLLLLLALDLLPARDVAIVLVDVGGEDVPALSVGDEIQRAVARRRRRPPPGSRRGRDCRSAPAAGRRRRRCCRASSTAGRRASARGPACPCRRSRRRSSSDRSRASSCRRRRLM